MTLEITTLEKKTVYVLGPNLISKVSTDIGTIWKPLIRENKYIKTPNVTIWIS